MATKSSLGLGFIALVRGGSFGWGRMGGLIFMTYSSAADKPWLDGLPAIQRQALVSAALANVTDKWQDMERDDREIISKFVARGASYWSVPAAEMAPWKQRVEGKRRTFAETYPEVIRKYDAILRSGVQ